MTRARCECATRSVRFAPRQRLTEGCHHHVPALSRHVLETRRRRWRRARRALRLLADRSSSRGAERRAHSAALRARELDNFEHDMDTQLHAWRKASSVCRRVSGRRPRPALLRPALASARRIWRSASSRRAFATRARAAISSRRASCCGWCAIPTTARSKRPRWKCSKPLLEADLLVLDDLGAERTSEWVQETLGLVVNTRYNAQAPDDLHEQPRRHAETTPIRGPSSSSSAPDALAAAGDVRLGRDPGRRRSRGRPARVGRGDRANWKAASPGVAESGDKGRQAASTEAQARAQLRPTRGDAELKWTGGKRAHRQFASSKSKVQSRVIKLVELTSSTGRLTSWLTPVATTESITLQL